MVRRGDTLKDKGKSECIQLCVEWSVWRILVVGGDVVVIVLLPTALAGCTRDVLPVKSVSS